MLALLSALEKVTSDLSKVVVLFLVPLPSLVSPQLHSNKADQQELN